MTELTPIDLLALTIFGEARSEPIEGKIGVANVAKNRRVTGRWGSTYETVCLAPLQFSCWSPKGGLSNYTMIHALSEQIATGHRPDDPVLTECYGLARAIDVWLRDNTHGATHYHTVNLMPPAWARGHAAVAHLGNHLFYVGIA